MNIHPITIFVLAAAFVLSIPLYIWAIRINLQEPDRKKLPYWIPCTIFLLSLVADVFIPSGGSSVYVTDGYICPLIRSVGWCFLIVLQLAELTVFLINKFKK